MGRRKTTTVRMIATLIRSTSEDAVTAAYSVVREPWRVRRVIGLVPQDLHSDDEMTDWDNVLLQTRLYGLRGREAVDRAWWALEYIDLLDSAGRKVARPI